MTREGGGARAMIADGWEAGAAGRPHGGVAATRIARVVLAVTAAAVALDVWIASRYGSSSFIIGVPLVAAATWRVLTAGRARLPTAPVIALCAFVAWCGASLTWAPAMDDALLSLETYGQLLAFVLVVWQLLGAEADVRALLGGYLAGCTLLVADAWSEFVTGHSVVEWEGSARYAAGGYDPNDMAATVALAIPVAAWFALAGRSRARWLVLGYIPLAAIAIGLSGSRGGTITAAVAVASVLAWAGRRSVVAAGWTAALAVLGVAATVWVVPEDAWHRILTIDSAVKGSFGDRSVMWRAGLDLANQHPLAGVGAGGYGRAAEALVGIKTVAHNTPIAIAVEFGAIGVLLFFGALALALARVWRKAAEHRTFASIFVLAWLVGTASLSWEKNKLTWLLFLLVAALGEITRARQRAASG